MSAPCVTEIADRCADDEPSSALDDAPELVARLAADPWLVVVIVENRDDALVAASRVSYVDLLADLGGAPHGGPNVAREERACLQARLVAG
jgi:hypothetical protein